MSNFAGVPLSRVSTAIQTYLVAQPVTARRQKRKLTGKIYFPSHTLQFIMTIVFLKVVLCLARWSQHWENEAGSKQLNQVKETVHSMTWWAEDVVGADGGGTYTLALLASIVLINAAQPFCFG